MADITLNIPITISDINKDVAIPAFLEVMPMPQIEDPDWADPEDGSKADMIDEYPSAKAWAEAYGAGVLNKVYLRKMNKGIDILNQKETQSHLTKL